MNIILKYFYHTADCREVQLLALSLGSLSLNLIKSCNGYINNTAATEVAFAKLQFIFQFICCDGDVLIFLMYFKTLMTL